MGVVWSNFNLDFIGKKVKLRHGFNRGGTENRKKDNIMGQQINIIKKSLCSLWQN